MTEHPQSRPTIAAINTLLSGATPQFAMQLKPRLWTMIRDLDPSDEVRRYGEAQLEMLDRLAMGTTRGAARTPGGARAEDPSWQTIPSHPQGSSLGTVDDDR